MELGREFVAQAGGPWSAASRPSREQVCPNTGTRGKREHSEKRKKVNFGMIWDGGAARKAPRGEAFSRRVCGGGAGRRTQARETRRPGRPGRRGKRCTAVHGGAPLFFQNRKTSWRKNGNGGPRLCRHPERSRRGVSVGVELGVWRGLTPEPEEAIG